MKAGAKALLIGGFLITGAINTLTKKFQFQTCSIGLPDEHVPTGAAVGCPPGHRKFSKPWSQNMMMFSGEAFVYLLFLKRTHCNAAPMAQDKSAPLIGDTKAPKVPFILFLMPAAFDVLATGLAGVGMLYISASVWQMMRGSVIVFTSILSVTCLGRKLYTFNWVAVVIAVIGLFCVGLSAILDGAGAGSSNVGLGIVFTVTGQFFTACQIVTEELYVKKYHAPPEQVVGSEGIWGIGMMIVLLYAMRQVPGKDVGGSYENALDAWALVTHSSTLTYFVLGYLVSIASFNYLGVTISKELSAVHRTINDALRTAIVWSVQVLLFYMGSSYGQGLTKHTWIQLIGFVFLINGTMINSQVLKLPCITYPGGAGVPRPMGAAMMSPSTQGVSVLSFPGSPLASPNVHNPTLQGVKEEDGKVSVDMVDLETS